MTALLKQIKQNEKLFEVKLLSCLRYHICCYEASYCMCDSLCCFDVLFYLVNDTDYSSPTLGWCCQLIPLGKRVLIGKYINKPYHNDIVAQYTDVR